MFEMASIIKGVTVAAACWQFTPELSDINYADKTASIVYVGYAKPCADILETDVADDQVTLILVPENFNSAPPFFSNAATKVGIQPPVEEPE